MIVTARRDVDLQQRITILLAEAERQRCALGDIIDDYRQVTGPADRLYNKTVDFIRRRPLSTTISLGIAGLVLLRIRRRLPSLPLRSMVRSASVATAVIRMIRRNRSQSRISDYSPT